MTTKQWIGRTLIFLFMTLVVLISLFPFYWMFITAVKPLDEIFLFPPRLWPSSFQWGNFAKSMEVADFGTYFKNSTIVTIIATTITVSINLLAGYAFAKYRFKGKEFFFLLVFSTLMIPMQVVMIPNFIIASRLGIRNTFAGLILPPCAEAFGLYMARQFCAEIPDELIEAARIDGATEFNVFTRIIVPNVKPLISVLIIFTVMWRWNDFQWPLIMVSNSSLYTVQLGISTLNGVHYVNWNDLMSASLIATLPIIVVFLIFQKQFVQGLVSSGIKG